ncbi:MAG: DciA family protein [Acidimicrobiales bacterium]
MIRPGGRRARRGAELDHGPRPLGEVLDEVVAGLAPPAARGSGSAGAPPGAAPSAAALGTVFSRWEELVGSSVARHTRPLRIGGGTLVVEVDQPAWATQLRILSPGILARLTERTGEPIERLDVVVGTRR